MRQHRRTPANQALQALAVAVTLAALAFPALTPRVVCAQDVDRWPVTTGDTVAGLRIFDVRSVSINHRGDVFFSAAWFGETEFIGGLGIFDLTGDRLLFTHGEVIDGHAVRFGSFAVNDSGEVLIRGFFTPDGGTSQTGIFSLSAGRRLVSAGDVIDGKQLTFVSDVSVNNDGAVIFASRYNGDGGSSGIFRLPEGDPEQGELLVAAGDVVDGWTLLGIGFGPGGNVGQRGSFGLSINDEEEVVYPGVFQDGDRQRSGIFSTTRGLLAAEGDVIDGKPLGDLGSPSVNNLGDVVFKSVISRPGGPILE